MAEDAAGLAKIGRWIGEDWHGRWIGEDSESGGPFFADPALDRRRNPEPALSSRWIGEEAEEARILR